MYISATAKDVRGCRNSLTDLFELLPNIDGELPWHRIARKFFEWQMADFFGNLPQIDGVLLVSCISSTCEGNYERGGEKESGGDGNGTLLRLGLTGKRA